MRDIKTPANAKEQEVAAVQRRPGEETARLGREFYEREILPQVEADHHGEVVAIDVDSKTWAIGADEIIAFDRLRAMRPESVNILCERVGHRALYRFGGRSLRWPQ